MRRSALADLLAALSIAGCTTAAPPPSAPSRSPSPASSPSSAPPPCCPSEPCCKDAPSTRDQPPDVKLKLGHYSNARRGIGLVFDRTGSTAKLRFDGTSEVMKLDRQPGAYGRTDYIRRVGLTVLQHWDNGRVVVFIPGSGEAAEGIEVRRDGDADPL